MEYLYQPLFKYIALILILFLFIHQYKIIDQDSYLLICVVVVVLVMMMDYFIIDKHPGIFEDAPQKLFLDMNDNDDNNDIDDESKN